MTALDWTFAADVVGGPFGIQPGNKALAYVEEDAQSRRRVAFLFRSIL
jgi:hypothetical protein